MKTNKYRNLRTVGMIVVAVAFLLLAGCGSTGAGDDGSGLTQEQAAQAAAEAFAALALIDADVGCISFEGDTVYFNNCLFEGISVNGQVTVSSLTDSVTSSSGSLILAGPGLPASPLTVSWSLLITVFDDPTSVSIDGSITVGGTTYNYDDLGVDYEA